MTISILYWFSLLQCWLLQLQLYMTLLYSYSLLLWVIHPNYLQYLTSNIHINIFSVISEKYSVRYKLEDIFQGWGQAWFLGPRMRHLYEKAGDETIKWPKTVIIFVVRGSCHIFMQTKNMWISWHCWFLL